MTRLLPLAIVGCAGSDITGPFTGEIRRYHLDAIVVPRDSGEATNFADDLDGDGTVDDRIGALTTTLALTNDLSVDMPSMIAAGAIASSIEIQADDLTSDDSVGVSYVGADGDPATAVGGRFVAGAFRSNRTRETRAPGEAVVRLPILTNADPVIVTLRGMELDLDPDGTGGYDAVVRGGIATDVAQAAAFTGVVGMMLDEPERHLVFARMVDANHDGEITHAELADSILGLVLAPDLQLYADDDYAPNPRKTAKDSVSLAFRVHLSPCATCAAAQPITSCRDRVRDAGETDVDCGGPCQKCQANAACAGPGDCQSGACDTGRCRAASCSDGVRDGFELDVDCGNHCSPCQLGQACAAHGDCASGHCDNALGALGHCVL